VKNSFSNEKRQIPRHSAEKDKYRGKYRCQMPRKKPKFRGSADRGNCGP